MKQLTALTCLAVLSFALIGYAADAAVNFSGEWILDNENSDPSPKTIPNLGAPEGGRGGGGGFGGGGFGGGFPGAKMPSGPAIPMVIQQTATEIKITTTTFGKPVVETYSLDGKQVVEIAPPPPNSKEQGKKKTKVSLKKNTLTIQQTTSYTQSETSSKKEYSLSQDGQTLTVKTKTNSVFAGGFGGNLTEQKQVYIKK